MNPTTQPEVHPNGESLNAFIEQALPATERQQILAHLAACDRCREVMFLAQEAVGTEADARTVAAPAEPGQWWQRWFAGWRWAWIPATALAGLVGFAALHRLSLEPSVTEVARNHPQEPVLKDSSEKALPVSNPTAQGLIETKAERPKSPPSKGQSVSARKASEPANSPADARDAANEMKSGAVAPSAQSPPYRGRSSPAQKTSSIGGPYVANNIQQQVAGQQEEVAKDQLHGVRFSAKAAGVAGGAAPGTDAGRTDAQSQTVSVAAAPAPASELTLQAAAKSNLANAADEVALSDKKKSDLLPNGTSAKSVATAGGRTVAIDPSGSVFLITSPGGQWTPVAIQWVGRAVVVRVSLTPSQAGKAQQATNFELVNDRNETWVSSNGKTWTAQPVSPQ
jgi:hypothetical protein